MRLAPILFIIIFFTSNCLIAQSVRDEQIDRDLKILLISDLNDSYGATDYSDQVHEVIGKIDQIQPDLILCGGDMVAGQDKKLTPDHLRAMWSGFNRAVLEPVSRRMIPFGFTVGNHDASPNYHNDRKAASEFWLANQDRVHLTFVDKTHFPYYFSYLKNNVFFISWDASSAHIPEEVRGWMQEQLDAPMARQARARILLGHLPLFAIVGAKNMPGEVIDDADKTLDFIRECGIDMYISGHQHAYFPAAKLGVRLLHSGCLGGGPRPLLGSEVAPSKSYAMIHIPKDSSIRHWSIEGITADQHSVIPLQSLPESIQGFNGQIRRMDIEEPTVQP